MADFPIELTNAVPKKTEIISKHLNNLEAKVGVDGSAVVTSLDYLLKNAASVEPGHKHSKFWTSDGLLERARIDIDGNVKIGPEGSGDELIINQVDRDFSGPGNWAGDGWVIESGKLKHNPGGAPAVLANANLVAGSIKADTAYTITVTVSGLSLGYVFFYLGDGYLGPAYENGIYSFQGLAIDDDADLAIHPHQGFDGLIDNISLVVSDAGLTVYKDGQVGVFSHYPGVLPIPKATLTIGGPGHGSSYGYPALLHLCTQDSIPWHFVLENKVAGDNLLGLMFLDEGGAFTFATGDGQGSYDYPLILMPRNYYGSQQQAGIAIDGCLGIGTWEWDTGIANGLIMASGTAPNSSPADTIQMWAEDINGAAGFAGLHKRTETTNLTEVVPGVVIKTNTGSPANPYEGLMEINTFDNKINMYADAAWRQLATW